MVLDNDKVLQAASSLNWDFPSQRIHIFVANALGCSVQEIIDLETTQSGELQLLNIYGWLTRNRKTQLLQDQLIPRYVMEATGSVRNISGLGSYLQKLGVANYFRITACNDIAAAIASRLDDAELELLTAQLMRSACIEARPTKRTGDQGLDAIGYSRILHIDSMMFGHDADPLHTLNYHKVFIFASCKNKESSDPKDTACLNPAHIRDLVGEYVIQRQHAGMWHGIGLNAVSPLQLLLVSTRRLSSDSWNLCSSLGIQVWTLPHLAYQTSLLAPDHVFGGAGNNSFTFTEFQNWIWDSDPHRLHTRAVTVQNDGFDVFF